MVKISMTPEQMEERAGQYATEAGKFQETIDQMSSLVTQLQSEWEGTAAESFAQRFTELKPSFDKTRQLIEDISTALKKSAAAYRETDSSVAQAWRG